MRKLPLFIAIVLFVTGLHTAWWFRHDIMDWYRLHAYGPLPDAVTHQQAQQQELQDLRARLIAEMEDRAALAPTEPYIAPAPVTVPDEHDLPDETDDGTAESSKERDASKKSDDTKENGDSSEESDTTVTESEERAADGGEGGATDEDLAAQTDADAQAAAAAELQRQKDAELRALEERRAQIGDSYNLAVPFTPQAPFAVWDALHEEACEEASAIMVKAFFDGETSLPPDIAEKRILDVVAWEDDNLGSDMDTDAEQTARFMREHLGMTGARAVAVSSIDDITSYVATGTPVIVPAYGKALGNPYFTGEGPLYHMLVVKGFQDGLIITNDPGTKRGADFIYDADTLWNAIHDWNDGDVQNGRKVMIVAE